MRIGILGTGGMASALAEAWAAKHEVIVGGRSADKAQAVADRIGGTVRSAPPEEVAARSEVIVVAVAWEGLDEILSLAGATRGSLAGKTVIDCTNAVDYATGKLKPEVGSAVEQVAELAVDAHVVKALHLFAGTSWLGAPQPGMPPRTVAMCGDDAGALQVASELIRDLGGESAVIGGLDHGRQLEDVAGFVMQLVAAGHNPVTAVPSVDVRGH